MGKYIDMIKESGQYRTMLGLNRDDLFRLDDFKFDKYMEMNNGNLFNPLSIHYEGMVKILNEPPLPNYMIQMSQNMIAAVGVRNFIQEVLTVEKPNPPKHKDLVECFGKGLACACCIECKLYNNGDLNV